MKHSFFNTLVVLTAVCVLAPHSSGESKFRIGGGAGRSQSGNGGHGSSSGNGSNSGQQGPANISNRLSGRLGHFKLSDSGNSADNQNSNSGHSIGLPGRHGITVNSNNRVTLPGVLQGNGHHKIQLPNGVKKTPIALNAAQFLKHHGPVNPVHAQQIQNIVAGAPKHLCGQTHFNWWVNACHNHNNTHYGCWNIHDHYWDCWTTCNWQVVQCQQFSYYVGLSCIHIPDMQAYGVQAVINGSPAHLAGLLAGDLILTVNGQPIFDPNLVNTELVRGRLDLQVVRQGSPAPLSLTIFPRLVQTVSF